MPRYNRRSISVRESVLRSCGSVETILLDERYAPYDRQGARIENLCGSFTEFVSSSPLRAVISNSNGQREMFHLHGNVVLHNGRASFLAVRGMTGLERLSRALHITSPRNVVHMVVLTSKIGRRVQVSSSGLLERFLAQREGHVRVTGRMYDHTNSVGFAIIRFEDDIFRMPAEFRPDSNDWTVTGKGMVIIRLIWKNVEWSRPLEDACLSMCNRVTDWLGSCT